MLDTVTQGVQAPAPVLRGQRIIVLGACCGFGRKVIRALDREGAQVVAADTDAEALARMQGAVPLTLRGELEPDLRRVGRAWGEARLDAVLNLMPLRHPARIDLNIAVLQGIVQGFMPALCAREGQILTVVSRPEQALDVGAGAMAPALLSVQAAFANALRHDGMSLNTITLKSGPAAPARAATLGMLARTLGPVTGTELRL